MALTQRQYDVLAEMGIPVWERRYPQAPLEPQASQLADNEAVKKGENEQIVLNGRCIVVVPELPLTGSEHSLLVAMLATIALPIEQIDLMDEATFQRLSKKLLQSRTVWAIGAAVDAGNVNCDSLKALLDEPQRKAMAWQALKQLANQIQ